MMDLRFSRWWVLPISALLLACTACGDPDVINTAEGSAGAPVMIDAINSAHMARILTVGIAYGGCEGPCPMQAYQVDATLNVQRFGGSHSDKPGFFQGECSPHVRSGIIALSDTLLTIPSNYHTATFDGELLEVVVITTRDTVRIVGERPLMPHMVTERVRAIRKLLDPVVVAPLNGPLSLGTRVQFTAADREVYGVHSDQ